MLRKLDTFADTMRFYRNTTNAVVQVLYHVFVEKRYADKVIESVLKQDPRWGARDRRFVAETSYEIIRWWRLISECADVKEINEAGIWKIFGTWCIISDIDPPSWEELGDLEPTRIRKNYDRLQKIFKVRESIPDWMDKLGFTELPERWEKEIQALNEQAHVVMRANTIKTNRGELQKLLQQQNIETHALDWAPDALVLGKRQNVFRFQLFKDGFFELQDAASQDVARFLQVEPGMRVIDACAGAGGKSLHLAALMKNKGKVIALDPEQWKLDELRKRARRAGAGNIEPKAIDSAKVVKRLHGTADRLLLDVPCSGLGVLKRNPDAKWKLSSEFIQSVKQTQQLLLESYSPMLKAGGLMVYSTCSILPGEDEKQIELFLNNHKDKFELINEKRHWPSEGFDGFYMALLRKHH
jgi:16S rRNA (cytosine967-C5)-methyltransferase